MVKQKYMVPGPGQIQFFTNHKKGITLVEFKSGMVCWIQNENIELFKKEIYGVIKKYKVNNNGNGSLQISF